MNFTQAATVMVPVRDQDAAIAFYADTLGFEVRSDFAYADGERWVEVVPPGAATALTLARARDGEPLGIETRIALCTADIEGDHRALRADGVDVDDIFRAGDPVVRWGGATQAGTPPMFLLRDPDGNSFLIVEQV
jgi:catechol 2,3-dioxygenase-like lactoylglutathione lyase family enzyme